MMKGKEFVLTPILRYTGRYLPDGGTLPHLREYLRSAVIWGGAVPKKNKVAVAMAGWLKIIQWNYFITLTTPYELTLPSARRLWGRFGNLMLREGGEPDKKMFMVAEKFECKDGFHVHGLLQTDIPYERIIETYQKASGVNVPENQRWNKFQGGEVWEKKNEDRISRLNSRVKTKRESQRIWARIDLRTYEPDKAAVKYCAKYLVKKYADYELFRFSDCGGEYLGRQPNICAICGDEFRGEKEAGYCWGCTEKFRQIEAVKDGGKKAVLRELRKMRSVADICA